MFVYSHNEGSNGARNLAAALKCKRIRHEGSAFVGHPKKVVINWGSSELPEEVRKCRVLNTVEAIAVASNKLRFFQWVQSLPEGSRPRIPMFTTDAEQVKRLVLDENKMMVARTVLNSSGGNGIHFISRDDPNSFVQAPLYTEYVKKKDEFRVHFFGKNIIDIQRKALRPDIAPENVNWKIRNLENGFIYARNNLTVPDDVRVQAQRVIDNTSLDFGAIDLIYNEQSNSAYVLEVNTAPGLQGTTITSYAEAIRAANIS